MLAPGHLGELSLVLRLKNTGSPRAEVRNVVEGRRQTQLLELVGEQVHGDVGAQGRDLVVL
jgi:hypothetical protein